MMHVFVYGTLRRSATHPMHGLLQPATFVGFARFQGRLYDLGNYPAAVASDDPADTVYGEVYELSEPAATLAALDHYEGCSPNDPEPHEYVRVAADIRLETGGYPVVSAQVYLYTRPVSRLTRIPLGDYLGRLALRSAAPADDLEKRTPPANSRAASS